MTSLCFTAQGGLSFSGRNNMRLILLSDEFYAQYGAFPEILKKKDRPYYCVSVIIDGHRFAIPLRHHIRHAYCFTTVGEAGLDYTKAILIDDPSYIASDQPWINSKEWQLIQSGENKIISGFRRFLHQYKRALAHKDNPRSNLILKYCSLKYFNF